MKLSAKYFAALAGSLLWLAAHSQPGAVDSLRKLMEARSGNSKIDLLNKLSEQCYILNTDSAFYYAQTALDAATTSRYWGGVSDALNNLGVIMRERSDLSAAEPYFRKALSISEKDRDSTRWSRDNLALANLLYYLGDCTAVDEMVDKSLRYYQAKENTRMVDWCYRFLGTIYTDKGYYEKAFSFFQRSFAIGSTVVDPPGSHSSQYMWNRYLLGSLYRDAEDYATALDFFREGMTRADANKSMEDYYRILGDIASMQNKSDSALYYYSRQVYYVRQRIKDTVLARTFVTDPLMNIGEIYLRNKQYDTARNYFLGLEPLIVKSNANTFILRLSRDLAKLYLGMRDWKNSFHYTRLLLDRAEKTGTRQYIRDGYELNWQLYDKLGKTDSAYVYLQRFTAIRDSIARDIQLRNIAVGQMKLWTQKQEVQIRLLENEKKIKSQQAQLLLYSLLGLLVLGFIVVRYIMLKRKHAVNHARQLEGNLKLQELESKNISMEFEKKKAELEMQALRAQMNPHFIFNSLNAINRFILENDKVHASTYLTRFSRLVRMILQHSQENLIALENEIECLKIYLELEALRFDNYFTYSIGVSPELDVSALKITPLIIQPYVENAIWHGLMHKDQPGRLSIDIFPEGDVLICKIVDDGIGRQQAATYTKKSTVNHKSMGMKITADRIARMMQETKTDGAVVIRDVVLADGSAGGTEVTLKIPVIYA